MPDEPVEPHHNNTNLLEDYMFPAISEADSVHNVAQLLDYSSLVAGCTSSTAMAPGYYSTTGADYANALPAWDMESISSTQQNSLPIDMEMCRTLTDDGDCSCHSGVTELLASMRGGGSSNDQRLSLVPQLAKLKQCIASSEMSMACVHGREDSEPIHIMAVAMLIGYVIDDFSLLARDFSLRKSSPVSAAAAAAEMAMLGNAERGARSGIATPNSTNTSLGALMEPRLSWGVLELEEDDEIDLRQRLYLLSFRKLEKQLSQLTLYLRDLHNAAASLPDPSRHMAFVIACDYTRLWLEKKAVNVKRLFSVPMRDEAMDSTLT